MDAPHDGIGTDLMTVRRVFMRNVRGRMNLLSGLRLIMGRHSPESFWGVRKKVEIGDVRSIVSDGKVLVNSSLYP